MIHSTRMFGTATVPGSLRTLSSACSSVLTCLAFFIVVAQPTEAAEGVDSSIAPGPASEPPVRARVLLDGAPHDVTLGKDIELADGRTMRVDLLPTRGFTVPGAFSFEYPREWNFSGVKGVPSPIDAWWTVNGEGVAIYLRRHTGDAEKIRNEYLTNLARTQSSKDGKSDPIPVTTRFGDRELTGHSCTYRVGSIGPGPTLDWEQRVFGWQGEDGAAWLLTVQQTIGTENPAISSLLPMELSLSGLLLDASDNEKNEGDENEDTTKNDAATMAPPSPHQQLNDCLASFRWARQDDENLDDGNDP